MASKITIKRSTTSVPPTGLSFGEMAFVQGTGLTANQLYVGISGGSPVWVGAQIGTTGSWTDNAAKTSLATQYAIDQRISAQVSANNVITTVDDNTNATKYLVFTSGAGAGVTLGVDVASGPLSYNPSTMEVILGGNLKISGDIVSGVGKATGDIFATGTGKLNIGLAASGITMGGTTGSIALRNPTLILGTTASTITTSGGTANNLTIQPYGDLYLSPTTTVGGSNSIASLRVSNSKTGGSQLVIISGGDLYLGSKDDGTVSSSNIIFEGATEDANKITLGTALATGARSILLPDASDTLVGKATTDTFTNKTFDTNGTGNVFRIAGVTLSAVTGTGSVVLATSPAITTSLTTGSASFTLLASPTTVNFAGAATTLNMGVVGGTAAFAGALTVAGDLTVNGTTTTINSTTLTVDDKNIEMAAIGTPDDATANGGGIIIKGTTDKSILWDSTNSNLTSNQDWNLPTGKVFKINNASVLSSSALGSGITGSSLTQVGTITSGTWSGSFGAVSGANLTVLTAGGLTGTIPAGVLGNSNVFIGTTSVALNRTGASLSLAGVNIDGSAGSATTATTATNANNIAVVSDTSDDTCFVTFVTATSGNLPAKINSTLTYNAVSGELSATLIDGGSF